MGKKAKSEGTKFEKDFEESIPETMHYHRYPDSMNFIRNGNPADYLITSTYALLVECKSTATEFLPLGNINMTQIWKMLQRTGKEYTLGGLLINFRKVDKTYFVFVEDFIYWYLNRDRQSLTIAWIKENGYLVSQKKRTKRWRYGVQGLINWIKGVAYNVQS